MRRLGYERKILLLALLGGLPAVAAALVLLAAGDYSAKVRFTAGFVVLAAWAGVAVLLRARVVRPLETFGNVLAAIREGELTLRGRVAPEDGALAVAMGELNALSESLENERLGALEATALLQRVIREIDVAIFTFDAAGKLRLVNPAGERLLGLPAARAVGLDAAELALKDALEGDAPRKLTLPLPSGTGPWELRRSTFRQGGLPHVLVVLADVQRVLREEEREAWKRLVRVLGHEINNSLAPIRSLAASVRDVVAASPRAPDWEDDVARGLEVIERRAEALGRFLAGYTKLARLPPPAATAIDVAPWLGRVAMLKRAALQAGASLTIHGDADQLDQLLINLLENAREAAGEEGTVTLSWRVDPHALVIVVRDDGPGLAETQNLFVPFFTTKPGGSGIGLALSRQIAEAHGGTLTLANREGTRGCEAKLVLPLGG